MKMYSDDDLKKAHLKDFQQVLARLEKEQANDTNITLEHRIKTLKELIKRCSD